MPKTVAAPRVLASGVISSRPRFALPAIALFAGVTLFAGRSAKAAANTEYDVVNGKTDLTAAATYSTGGTAGTGVGGTTPAPGTPTVTSDVTFDSGVAYSPAAFTLNSSQTFGSLNDLSTTALTIANTSATGTGDTLTLGGSSDPGSSVPGASAGDLLFVGTGATLTINSGATGSATALGLVLGQSGNFDIAGTASIGSAISGTFNFTKTGAGLLTLSGAVGNGGTITNAGTGTTGNLVTTAAGAPAASLYISGAIGGSVTGIVQNSATSDLLLGGNNSAYNNGITIQSGTLLINSTANALGASTNVVTLGNSAAAATLQYGARLGTGTGQIQSFANPISVSGTGTNVISATDYNLTLSGPISLTGNGTTTVTNLTLASLNNSGSAITISGGVTGTGNIVVSDDFASAGGVVNFTTAQVNNIGTITFNNAAVNGGTAGTGTGTNTITGGVGSNVTGIINSGTNPLTISTGAFNLNSAGTTLTNSGALFTVSSAITGSSSLTLVGLNGSAFTLGGMNTYSGATNLNSGTLTLTGSLSSPTLNLASGTFNYSATGTNTQGFTTTNLTGLATVNNTVATDTLSLGSIVRTSPGTVNFATTTGAITTSNSNDASGILGPWATIGTGTALNYAVANGSSAITAYASGTALTAAGGGTANTTNFTLGNAGVTLGTTSPVTANTLQVLNTDVTGITLANGGNNVTLNGILMSGGTGGGLTISGTGQLLAGATKEIDITTNADGVTLSSVIADSTAGKSSLVFNSISGGGFTLGANNLYTGNTYINSGTINVNSGTPTAFGVGGTIYLGAAGNSGTVSIITQNSSSTYANPITVEPGGRRYLTTNVGNSPTFSGGISLVGGATLEVGPNANAGINLSGGATGTGNIVFGAPTNGRTANQSFSGSSAINITGTLSDTDTFSGNTNSGLVTISAPIQGATAVLQNSGSSQFVLTGTNTYTGGTNITASYLDDQVAAALTPNSTTTVGPLGTLVLGVGSAAAFTSANVDSLLANTLAHVSLSSTSGAGLDTTPGNFTYASNATTTRFLTKIGTNSLILTGADNFFNNIVVSAGTLQLGDGTTDGSLGLTPAVVNNAAVVFNVNSAQSYAGVITGSGTLTKSGAGTLTLSGANFFTGNTTVSAGTLDLSGSQALQNSALQTGGTGLVFDQSVASHSFVIGGLNGGTALALTDNGSNAVALTLHLGNGATDTYNSVLSGTGSLTISGANSTQKLGGANTYTGGTAVTLGQLQLDFTQTGAPTSNILYNGIATQTSAEALTMGGVGAATNSDGIPGANFLVTGKASTTNTQTFYGLTLNPGVSNITITPGTSGNVQLNFTNGLTHNAGGVINFTDTQSTTNYINLGTATNDATGILGGYATVNGTAYASVNGSGQVIPYTYTTTVAAGGVVADGTATNVQLTGAGGTETLGVASGTTNINTLTNSGTSAETLTIGTGNTLRLGINGGILQGSGQNLTVGTANVGTLTAGGNASGTAGEISLVTRNGGTTTINSVIANNNASTGAANSTGGGAVTLTIGETSSGGATYVLLNGNNTYSGGTYLLGSRVQASTTTSYGTGPVYVMPGAQAYLNASGNYANTFNIGGIGANESGFNFAIRFVNNGTTTISGGVNLLGDSVIAGNGTNAITGNLSGTGSLNIFGGTTFTLGSASSTDTITGNLSINGFVPGTANNGGGNTLKLGGAAALPNGTSSGNVIINGGAVVAGTNVTLDVNGFSASTNGLVSSGANVASSVITNSGASATLTIGDNNANAVFGGTITDGGTSKTLSIVKAGTGTQVFGGANTYNGTTTVNAGTLLFNGSLTPSVTGGSAVTVGSTTNTATPATLGGTGTLTVTSATVNSNGTLAPGATLGATTGALTLNTTSGVTLNGTLAIALGTTGNNGTFVNTAGGLNVSGATLSLTGSTPSTSMGVYDLVNYTGTLTASGSNEGFTSINGPAGFSYSVVAGSTFSATDLELDVTAVPEPSTWLGGLVAAGAVGYQMRRRLSWLGLKRRVA